MLTLAWLPFPKIDPKVPTGMLYVPEGWVVASKSKNKEAAKLFVDTIARDIPALTTWWSMLHVNPLNTEAAASMKVGPESKKELDAFKIADYAFIDTGSAMEEKLQPVGYRVIADIVLKKEFKNGLAELDKESQNVFKK